MDEAYQQANSRDSELSWLSAAIESEGWFTFNVVDRCKSERAIEIYPIVGIVNTDWQFIQVCNEISRRWITGCHLQTKRYSVKYPNSKPLFRITWNGMKRVKSLLTILMPYFRSGKKKRAELLLEFVNSRFEQKRNGFSYSKGKERGVKKPDKNSYICIKPLTIRQTAVLLELRSINMNGKPIAKGTLEKLQRLNAGQYDYDKSTEDKVQIA